MGADTQYVGPGPYTFLGAELRPEGIRPGPHVRDAISALMLEIAAEGVCCTCLLQRTAGQLVWASGVLRLPLASWFPAVVAVRRATRGSKRHSPFAPEDVVLRSLLSWA